MIRISKSERFSKTRRLKPYVNKWRNRWKEEKDAIHEMKTQLKFGESCHQTNRRVQ